MTVPSRDHLIALINFSGHELEVVRRGGFCAELGFLGEVKVTNGSTTKHLLKRPPYEYDVYVYRSPSGSAPQEAKPLPDRDLLRTLTDLALPPRLCIAFLGEEIGNDLGLVGLPWFKLAPADEGLSLVEPGRTNHAFALPALERCLLDLRSSFARPFKRFLFGERVPQHPYNHFVALKTRSGDILGVYGTVYDTTTKPVYIVIPECRDNANALLAILDTLTNMEPSFFPGRPGKRAWLDSAEFTFKEQLRIDEEIANRKLETDRFVKLKLDERDAVAKPFEHIRKILTATEDNTVARSDRLSVNVRLVLEFLGFEVVDIDEAIRSAIKKEDYWVIDGDFHAIAEVTATRSKNPKTKEYNDLLGRMSTIYKRRDLVPDAHKVTGMLVVNYDIDTNPSKRPQLYAGDTEEVVLAAKDQGIGLLSTVDLYRIAIDVKDGRLNPAAARSILKQAGRLEYAPRSE